MATNNAPVIMLAEETFFSNNGWRVPWREHPILGPLNDGPVATPRDVYDWGDFKVEVLCDVTVNLSTCAQNSEDLNFDEGDSLLVGDNLPSLMPIRLKFTPSVRAVGSKVCPNANGNSAYAAQVGVKIAGTQNWFAQMRPGVASNNRGTAPFVGLRAPAGKRIDQVFFDVLAMPGAGAMPRVSINDLYFML